MRSHDSRSILSGVAFMWLHLSKQRPGQFERTEHLCYSEANGEITSEQDTEENSQSNASVPPKEYT